jgi:hypothetical protein
MKHLLILTVCFLFFIVTPAQTLETFDIATFQAPRGWTKEVKDGALIYSTSDKQKGTYAMIVLYTSGKSSTNPKTDFETDWRQFASGIGVKASPQIEPQRQTNGWIVVTGGATFESDLGTSAVILSTYSGFGKKFSAAAIFNSQDYVAAVDTFASSIVLNKTAPTPQTATPTEGNVDTALAGTWGKQAGAHMTYGDPVAAGMAGYSKDQYTFNGDGTYSFVSKTFRMSFDKIILIKESGAFQTSGDTLVISPQKSIIQAWSKLDGVDKWGRLLSTQNRALEKVTYRFTRHYFSGIDQWNLVLQADRPTERDGPFSNNTTFSNAWYYAPISANNPVITLPR